MCIYMDQVVIYVSCMDRVMYMRVFNVYAWIEFICICECLYVYMHGSSYVYASVYMCICMVEFICICECLYV